MIIRVDSAPSAGFLSMKPCLGGFHTSTMPKLPPALATLGARFSFLALCTFDYYYCVRRALPEPCTGTVPNATPVLLLPPPQVPTVEGGGAGGGRRALSGGKALDASSVQSYLQRSFGAALEATQVGRWWLVRWRWWCDVWLVGGWDPGVGGVSVMHLLFPGGLERASGDLRGSAGGSSGIGRVGGVWGWNDVPTGTGSPQPKLQLCHLLPVCRRPPWRSWPQPSLRPASARWAPPSLTSFPLLSSPGPTFTRSPTRLCWRYNPRCQQGATAALPARAAADPFEQQAFGRCCSAARPTPSHPGPQTALGAAAVAVGSPSPPAPPLPPFPSLQVCYKLYETFRPGWKGWGQKGSMSLSAIRQLASEWQQHT